MSEQTYTFTSESVSEGHPDKVCDFIADSILDACLAQDPNSRVACEVLCKDGHVVLAGEITTNANVDYEAIARQAIREIGYTDPTEPFNADGVQIKRAHLPAVGRDRRRCREGDRRSEGAGRRRPGHHVRLRDRRDAGADAAAARCSRTGSPRGSPTTATAASIRGCAPTPSRRSRWATRATPRCASRACWCPRSTPRTSRRPTIRDYVVNVLGAPRAGRVVHARRGVHRQPQRQLRPGRPVGRLRRHRPQDHRRHLRRRGPPRRRRVQRQGPVEGRPQRRVLLPVRRAPGREGRPGAARRSAGRRTPSAAPSRCR